MIERSTAFVQHLRARFPGVAILHGDAADLGRLLPRSSRIDAIVSSLPLLSLPAGAAPEGLGAGGVTGAGAALFSVTVFVGGADGVG